MNNNLTESSTEREGKHRRKISPKPSRPTTLVVFGMCRLGFILAAIAHAFLFAGALWMIFIEKKVEYVFFAIGYGLIAGLVAEKGYDTFSRRRALRNNGKE